MSTGIAWTDETRNVSVGCSEVSEGCAACYAAGVAHRGMQEAHRGLTLKLPGRPVQWNGTVRLLPERIDSLDVGPKPKRVFVNSMSDLFHNTVPYEFVEQVVDRMGDLRHHQFQVLTKRPQRMADLMDRYYDCDHGGNSYLGACPFCAPHPNLWLGVSVESPKWAWRIRWLRKTPAAVRFVSWEPTLAPPRRVDLAPSDGLPGVDWVIFGGESGPRARPCDPGWIREGVAICRDLGITPFVKQLGTVWAFEHLLGRTNGDDPDTWPEDLRVQEFPVPLPVPA